MDPLSTVNNTTARVLGIASRFVDTSSKGTFQSSDGASASATAAASSSSSAPEFFTQTNDSKSPQLDELRGRVAQIISPATSLPSSYDPYVSPSVNACTPPAHPLRWWLRGPGFRSFGADNPIDGRGRNLFQPGWQWVNQNGVVLTRDCVSRPSSNRVRTIDESLKWEASAADKSNHADIPPHAYQLPLNETAGSGFAAVERCSASWDHLQSRLQQRQSGANPGISSSSAASSPSYPDHEDPLPPTAERIEASLKEWSESELNCFIDAHQRLSAVAAAFTSEDVAATWPLEWANPEGRGAMGQAPFPWKQWYESHKNQADNHRADDSESIASRTRGDQVNASLRGATQPIFFLLPWGPELDRRPQSPAAPSRRIYPVSSAEEMAWIEADKSKRGATLRACLSSSDLFDTHADIWHTSPPFYTASESKSLSSLAINAENMIEEGASANIDRPSHWMSQLSSVVRGCPWPLISTSCSLSQFETRVRSESMCAARHIAAQLRLLDLTTDTLSQIQQQAAAVASSGGDELLGGIELATACVDLHLFWTACRGSVTPIVPMDSEGRKALEQIRMSAEREPETRSAKPCESLDEGWKEVFASRVAHKVNEGKGDTSQDANDDVSSSQSSASRNRFLSPLSSSTASLLSAAFPHPIQVYLTNHYSPAPVVIASPIAPGWVACILAGANPPMTSRFC